MALQESYGEKNETDEKTSGNVSQKEPKKLNGAGFMMILMLGLFKDFSDVFLDIGFITSVITGFTGLCVSGIIWFYLFYNRISFSNKKLATMVVMTTISLIPILNILPETTVGLLLIRAIEHSERLERLAKVAVVRWGK
ncbi:MAG: hypothetical protein HZC03_01500 [Candidatus Lloydbacteria bacterium]|nr:hypothetical protein [Candidatus Lloydbacteria bacterium]